jgi:hypothetical protein
MSGWLSAVDTNAGKATARAAKAKTPSAERGGEYLRVEVDDIF